MLAVAGLLGVLAIAYWKGRIEAPQNLTKKSATVICALGALTVLSPIFFVMRSDLDVKVSENAIEISGPYGTQIGYGDIREVSLQNSLPDIKIRANGFSFGDTRVGSFVTTDNRTVTLYSHSDGGYVRIIGNDNSTYYMNFKQPNETRRLYEELRNKVAEIGGNSAISITMTGKASGRHMTILNDGEENDTFNCNAELFRLYGKCFKKTPQREPGPYVYYNESVVEFGNNFGMNCCDKYPDYIYTKLDTNTVKSRYPNLPFYAKERQPSDSECVFVWQIDDNWYMISH